MTICGTYGGYQQHTHKGTRPCGPCRDANAEYHRKRREANPAIYLADRNQAAAYRRALTRLRQRYPNVFARYYAEEKGL